MSRSSKRMLDPMFCHPKAPMYKCDYCFNLGFETYIKNGIQMVAACPDCTMRAKGVMPIPPYELGIK